MHMKNEGPQLTKENLLGQFTKIDIPTYEYCLAIKTTRKPFAKWTRVETPLQLNSLWHL